MNITNKKILISGGLGFIGSAIVKQLVEQNKITIIDNQHPANSPLAMQGLLGHPNISVKICSIDRFETMQEISQDFDYIIHLAAVLGVAKVIAKPLHTMEINGVGTMNMLRIAMSQKKLSRFMFFSTSEVYGLDCNDSREDSYAQIPLEGIRWNYSCSKVFGEYLVKSVAYEHGIPYVIIRPFNVYGPYRSGENAMSSIVSKALDNEDISITGDGSQVRAWCHINDFANGVVIALNSDKSVNQSFNIGNDTQVISMNDLTKSVVDTLGSKSKIKILGNKIEDIQNRSPNIDKARMLLDYNPQIDLEQGILSVANWIRESRPDCIIKAG